MTTTTTTQQAALVTGASPASKSESGDPPTR